MSLIKECPAHEAILGEMDTLITKLRMDGTSDGAALEAARQDGAIHGFIRVLRKIPVPEERCRKEIVHRLLQLKNESHVKALTKAFGELAEHFSVHKLSHVGKLMDLMVASVPLDPSHPGPVAIQAMLWDGRTVTASYTNDAKSDDELGYLVERLLSDGEPFVTTVTDTDELVCVLKWTIE